MRARFISISSSYNVINNNVNNAILRDQSNREYGYFSVVFALLFLASVFVTNSVPNVYHAEVRS